MPASPVQTLSQTVFAFHFRNRQAADARQGRLLSVTATATMISLAHGASLICTSMPSKWLRTKAASL